MGRPPEENDENVDLSRIVAFTDGIFAIAITLLVLNFDIPERAEFGEAVLAHYVEALGGDVLAYFLTFAVLGRMWVIHHWLFGRLARFDSPLMVLNLAYLSLIVLVPFAAELLGDYGDQELPVAIYALVLTVAVALNSAMFRHATSAGLLRHDGHEAPTRAGGREALLIASVFAVSIPIAFVLPFAAVTMWIALVVLRAGQGVVRRRRSGGVPRAGGSPRL